jgi:uncharacterized repeat protein (TIGR03803 family)
MKAPRLKCRWLSIALIVSLIPLSASAKWKEKVLYTFTGGKDGGLPYTTLVFDHEGNLYGVADGGGDNNCNNNDLGCGAVFRLSRNSGGGWTETVLYRFKGTEDGYSPNGPLVFDSAGNLFGVTTAGGKNKACTYVLGCGTVFELKRDEKRGWKKVTLYSFGGGRDGQSPSSGIIFDAHGRLYGTTYFGGVDSCYAGVGCGTVFELTETKSGEWSERVLYRFHGGADGASARAGLTLVGRTLYGATEAGGGTGCYGLGCGILFQLRFSGGTWAEQVLYSFTGIADGAFPEVGLVPDGRGTLYGIAMQGGDQNCVVKGGLGGCGTVFSLTKSKGGCKESTIYSFAGGKDGIFPEGLAWHGGSLYGTTVYGGSNECSEQVGCGTVFQLRTSDNGWDERVLYSFDGTDGEYPYWEGVVFDHRGRLYGTTSNGGSYSWGNVYELVP